MNKHPLLRCQLESEATEKEVVQSKEDSRALEAMSD